MKQLQQISQELLQLHQSVGPFVVRVNGRRGPNATGVVWTADEIVTSNRAVHRDQQVEVGFQDGSTVLAEVKGRLPDLDLACLKLPTIREIAEAPWTEEVTPGMMFALARDRAGVPLTKLGFLPTTTLTHRIAPAPEFLGSPLIDLQGRLLGLHVHTGRPGLVGYAQLKELMERLDRGETFEPAYLGVGLHPVDHGPDPACLVVQVDEAASQAGILVGDLLLSINEVPVGDPEQVRELLRSTGAGTQVTLVLSRGGTEQTLPLTLQPRPRREGFGRIGRHIRKVIRHIKHHGPPGPHHHDPHHAPGPEFL